MKKLALALALLVTATSAHAVTAFKTGERVSGMNKICYYSALGSTYTLNISSVALCPLSIEV